MSPKPTEVEKGHRWHLGAAFLVTYLFVWIGTPCLLLCISLGCSWYLCSHVQPQVCLLWCTSDPVPWPPLSVRIYCSPPTQRQSLHLCQQSLLLPWPCQPKMPRRASLWGQWGSSSVLTAWPPASGHCCPTSPASIRVFSHYFQSLHRLLSYCFCC